MLQHGHQIKDLGEYFSKLWFINTLGYCPKYSISEEI